MIISVIGGLLVGFIGFLPLCFALKHIKNTPSTSALLPMSTLLISLIVSFAFLVIAALAFNKFMHENAAIFVFGEALALSASAIIFGVKKQRKNS